MGTWHRCKNITDQVTWTCTIVIIIIVTQQVTKSKLLSQQNYVHIIYNTKYTIYFKNKSFPFPLIYGWHPCSHCYFGNFSLPGGHFGVLGALLAAYTNSGSVSLLQIRKGVVTLPATNIIKTQKRLQWQFKSALTQWMTRHKAGLKHTDFIRRFPPSSRFL